MYRLPHSHSLAPGFAFSVYVFPTLSLLNALGSNPSSQPCTATRECPVIILMEILQAKPTFPAIQVVMVHAALINGNAKAMASAS